MVAPLQMDWWPERQLQRHPIRNVFVCGHKIHPPVASHVVNFPRLEVPLSGCYENQVDLEGTATLLQLRPGTALFSPSNSWNLPTWRKKVNVMSLLFGHKQLGVSIVAAPGKQNQQMVAAKFSMPRPMTGRLPHILQAMLESAAHRQGGNTLPELAQAVVQCVKVVMLETSDQTNVGRAQGLLERACVYLQSHYQYDITRDSVAREFRVTPQHLSRLFQSHGNTTFINYLTHVRINRAKHLLSNYALKLDDIAKRCGYCDTPYFCRVFKRVAKATPAQYREAHAAGLEKDVVDED